ncbi:MAG: glycosyltransferase [Cyanobacteria bacterium P01_A01_bin.45]
MKVVYIVSGLFIGGAETMLYNILSKMDKEKFTPYLISLLDGGALSDRVKALNIPVYSLGMKRGQISLKSLFQLLHIVNQIKPDIIQGWMYHGNIAAFLVKLFLFQKITVFWSIHHSIDSLSDEKKSTSLIINLSAPISKLVDKVFFVSKRSQKQHQEIGYSSRNSYVIPNGFDTSLFQPSAERKSLVREELNLSEDTFIIGSFARYHAMKDFPNFLKAAAILSRNCPNVSFILAGTNVDIDNQDLCNLVKKLEIEDKVHLLGERSDIDQLMTALDVFTISSAYGEAFPLVLGEAMSCGIPCVVTDVGDSSWILGELGKVVPPRNSQALAQAWKELISIDRKEMKSTGERLRERIVDNFSLEAITFEYEKNYCSSLS